MDSTARCEDFPLLGRVGSGQAVGFFHHVVSRRSASGFEIQFLSSGSYRSDYLSLFFSLTYRGSTGVFGGKTLLR